MFITHLANAKGLLVNMLTKAFAQKDYVALMII